MRNIHELREELFETLRALRSKDAPIDIERAKAVAEIAQVVINSAKVEVEHLRVTGGRGSGFIPEQLPQPGVPRLVRGKDMRGE